MFIIFLKFGDKRADAPLHMEGHNAWLKEGFDAGVFLTAGSLQPGLGGAIIATGEDRAATEARIAADPFFVHGIVTAEIHEMSPARTDPRLSFLVA